MVAARPCEYRSSVSAQKSEEEDDLRRMLRQRCRFPTRVLMPFLMRKSGVLCLGRRCHGRKWNPACRHFFNEPADGLGWSAAVATPASIDPPSRLIGCLSGFPRQNFEKLLGDRFL